MRGRPALLVGLAVAFLVLECSIHTSAVPAARIKALVAEKAALSEAVHEEPAANVEQPEDPAAAPNPKGLREDGFNHDGTDPNESYEYDEGERLYADQEEDFEAYGAEAQNKSKDAADEYERYLEEITKDMMEDPSVATDIIEELEEMQDHEGMPDEEKALLKIARRIRAQEDTRTRLEEQERETINRQRRETRREHERENGLKQRAGDFDFHDEDSKIWLKDDIDEQALVDIAKKRVHQLQNLDRSRRVAFLQHEMKRLMEFKKAVLLVADPAKKAEMIKKHEEETHILAEERGHAPGHKAMLEEIWESDDGMDKDNFNPKTMFRLHDLNGDNVLDIKELEALFYNEAQKLHAQKKKKPEGEDKFVVREEMARMREFVTKEADKDEDGMISMSEWMKFTGTKEFEEDKEWEPVNPDKEITDKQLENFKKLNDKMDKTKHHELDPKMMKVAKEIQNDFNNRGKHGQAKGAAVEPHDAVKHHAPPHDAKKHDEVSPSAKGDVPVPAAHADPADPAAAAAPDAAGEKADAAAADAKDIAAPPAEDAKADTPAAPADAAAEKPVPVQAVVA